MALKATIYKAELQVSDLDRHYYASHSLTLACHPSETEERLMVRLLAFALHASDTLQFTRGLSSDDEPDLWEHTLTGEIDHWIEVGLPDERRIRKACGRARRVSVMAYGGRTSDIWWRDLAGQMERYRNLAVVTLPKADTDTLATLCQRNMHCQVTIQEGQLWWHQGEHSLCITPEVLWPR